MSEKEKMTAEELIEALNDPANLSIAQQKIQQMGLAPVQTPAQKPTPQKKEQKELKKPDKPQLNDDAEAKEVNAAWAKYHEELEVYYEDKEKQKVVTTKEETENSKAIELQQRVQKFKADPKKQKNLNNPLFLQQMESQFSLSNDLQKAYDDTIKLLNIKEEKEEKKEEESKGRPSLSTKDETAGNEELKGKPLTWEEAGKEAMKEVKARHDNADELIKGE